MQILTVDDIYDFELKSKLSQKENPYFINVFADFIHEESGKVIKNVPGFFNTSETWFIRFSPRLTGKWKAKTHSTHPGLDGHQFELEAKTKSESSQIPAPLAIDPNCPSKFITEDGDPEILIGFECDWLFSFHQSQPEKVEEKLKLLKRSGFNYIVTNLYVHSFREEFLPDPEDSYSFPRLFPFGGSNEKPDHSQMNPDFFEDFDSLIHKCHQLGMRVHLMFQAHNKEVNWPERFSKEDELFWKYITARYQAFSNMVFDIGKEPFLTYKQTGSHDYNKYCIDLIRKHNAYHRFVLCHDAANPSPGLVGEMDQYTDFTTDQIHLPDCVNYNREAQAKIKKINRPYINIEYGYELGVEAKEPYIDGEGHSVDWQTMLKWTWSIYMAGAYANYYYSNTAWNIIQFDPVPYSWRSYSILRHTLENIPFNKMKPRNDLVDRGFCLAEEEKTYLIFLPEGGDFSLDLSFLPHKIDSLSKWVSKGEDVCATWIDIFHGGSWNWEMETKPQGWYTRFKNPFINKSQAAAVIIQIEEKHLGK